MRAHPRRGSSPPVHPPASGHPPGAGRSPWPAGRLTAGGQPPPPTCPCRSTAAGVHLPRSPTIRCRVPAPSAYVPPHRPTCRRRSPVPPICWFRRPAAGCLLSPPPICRPLPRSAAAVPLRASHAPPRATCRGHARPATGGVATVARLPPSPCAHLPPPPSRGHPPPATGRVPPACRPPPPPAAQIPPPPTSRGPPRSRRPPSPSRPSSPLVVLSAFDTTPSGGVDGRDQHEAGGCRRAPAAAPRTGAPRAPVSSERRCAPSIPRARASGGTVRRCAPRARAPRRP